jgi:lysylphosphatidylglycerol synthetase-like protein (DUF2156 family)
MGIKASRVVGVIVIGLLIVLVLPAMNVNATLSAVIAFTLMLVAIWVLAARREGARRRDAVARDEARSGGSAGGRDASP